MEICLVTSCFWNFSSLLGPVPGYLLNTLPWQIRSFSYLAPAHPSRFTFWHLPSIFLQPSFHHAHTGFQSWQTICSFWVGLPLCTAVSFCPEIISLPPLPDLVNLCSSFRSQLSADVFSLRMHSLSLQHLGTRTSPWSWHPAHPPS